MFFSILDNSCYKFAFQWHHLHIFFRVLLLYSIYWQAKHKGCNSMRSRNRISTPTRGFFRTINGDHNHVPRHKSYSWVETDLNRWKSFSFRAMPSPNILDLSKARQDLPLPDSRIGAFEPSFYGMIIHAALNLLAYVK